jgi:hypothetical protein
MINKLLMGVFKIIISLVSLLLTPIDNLIAQFLPGLDDAFTMIGNLVQQLCNVVPWVMSWMGVSSVVVSLLVSYLTFKMSVPIVVHTIKLALKWYDKLKP